MTLQIEIGHTYILDGKTPVRVLKFLNRSKTTFSIEMPDKGIDTVGIERLQTHTVDEFLEEGILDFEPEIHSMPEISNDWSGEESQE
jgi:hypothetical protein